jgi:hypothetical protein
VRVGAERRKAASETMTDDRGERASRARYWVVVFAVVLAIIQYVDRVCISKAMPAIQKDLGVSSGRGFSIAGFATIRLPRRGSTGFNTPA